MGVEWEKKRTYLVDCIGSWNRTCICLFLCNLLCMSIYRLERTKDSFSSIRSFEKVENTYFHIGKALFYSNEERNLISRRWVWAIFDRASCIYTIDENMYVRRRKGGAFTLEKVEEIGRFSLSRCFCTWRPRCFSPVRKKKNHVLREQSNDVQHFSTSRTSIFHILFLSSKKKQHHPLPSIP